LQHRLFHARRLLATTDRKLLDIAMERESGFGSASRFYESFTRACVFAKTREKPA
jgi:transcriptional regulator GlxA family with amidase domain